MLVSAIHLGDTHGRRWILCLQSEYQSIMNGIKYLKEDQGIVYEGFPTSPDRFMFLDTVLEALSEFVHSDLSETFQNHYMALQEPENVQFSTPWDKNDAMFCSFHREEVHSRFCALSTGRKACLASFHAVKDGYNLPVGD